MKRYYLSVLTLMVIFISDIQMAGQLEMEITPAESKDVLYYQQMGASPRIAEIMSQMTMEEKIGQLNLITPGGTVTGEVVSKNVSEKIRTGQVGGIFGIRGAAKVREAQELAVTESRLGIPLLVGMDVIHGHQTIFPIPLGLSCTWDLSLIERSARIAAKEATADGLMWAFSPMVDIARDPRWGRIAEGAGEDPFLGSRIAEAMVKGYQGNDLSDPTTLMACVKHFALYGAPEGGRDYATVDMSKTRMFNEYLPPYKAAVNAGVGSVMTSFNVVDYVPATASEFLFNKVLREMWGFQGLVVTDYTCIDELVEHGIGTLKDVTSRSLNATVDMDMVSEAFLNTLYKGLEEGLTSIRQIEKACLRILKAKEDLGLFDNPYKYCNEDRAKTDILNDNHRTFARKAAGESFVLLKNSKDILPLQKNTKVALIGPLADSRRNMLGTWSVSGDHELAVTVLEGMKNVSSDPSLITYAKGANISDDREFAQRVNVFGEEIIIDERSPEDMIKEAVTLAETSDVIVAVVGEAADMSGESSSMTYIGLQPGQKRLLRALKATGKPVVMVLYNGRPMTIGEELDSMDAVLDVWFGGTEGGNAVADVLYGDVNPGGKLTTSFPVNVGQIPVYHSMLNTGRPNTAQYPKFRTNYLDAPNAPLLPFGFGLSYTSFEYSQLKISSEKMSTDGTVRVAVTVKNTGQRAGHEIVQMYIRDVEASISRPMKELKGFEKVFLQPGVSRTVVFTINADLLAFYDETMTQKVEKGLFQVMVGPNSADVQTVSFILE